MILLSISRQPRRLGVVNAGLEIRMKYLCLVYLEKEKWHAVPDRECANCGQLMTQDEYHQHLRAQVDRYRTDEKLAHG